MNCEICGEWNENSVMCEICELVDGWIVEGVEDDDGMEDDM